MKVNDSCDDVNSGPLDLRVTTHSIDVRTVSSYVNARHNSRGKVNDKIGNLQDTFCDPVDVAFLRIYFNRIVTYCACVR